MMDEPEVKNPNLVLAGAAAKKTKRMFSLVNLIG